MTANKNLTEQRKLGKMKASMELVARHLAAYTIALKKEQHLPIPVFSAHIRIQSDMEVRALAAIPSKYFKPDGTIDKRRQRLDTPYGKSYIIKGNG